jgi:hypothetical protein
MPSVYVLRSVRVVDGMMGGRAPSSATPKISVSSVRTPLPAKRYEHP